MWASYDVLDVWYQKAEYGDIWMPYLHIRMTPGEVGTESDGAHPLHGETNFATLGGEHEPFKI
ncbi:hypothetical protein FGU71_13835 [Erythrobacter insulae]|uniref:Uncharacterized protein n=2 Tax=Erythrobacter insulae TaxID=2584124 RepID=A0A547P7E1_9SPHN|nr:hypothetical protein FGU71_13835 [Erythrobacter insulae]